MDKYYFMKQVEEHASNEFICNFCNISMEELERLIELDDYLMLVSDTYDQMSNEELKGFEEDLSRYYFHR